jgi:DNA polymerase-3 subunit epsilon
MRLLGIDYETTGLDPVVDNIIEVGAVIWDTELHVPLVLENFFVKWGTPISAEITAINGVTDDFVETFGLSPSEGLSRIHTLEWQTAANVAHNGAAFDRPFHRDWLRRVYDHYGRDDQRLWIDTQNDIDYAEDVPTRKLTYLAAEHGFLNPFAHRAVFDVLTMMVIFDKYPLPEIIYSAQQPNILVQALVSYDNKEQAKEMRFRWDGDNKRWIRTFKAHKFKAEDYKFKTRIVEL